jgi:hypothetical protein
MACDRPTRFFGLGSMTQDRETATNGINCILQRACHVEEIEVQGAMIHGYCGYSDNEILHF